MPSRNVAIDHAASIARAARARRSAPRAAAGWALVAALMGATACGDDGDGSSSTAASSSGGGGGSECEEQTCTHAKFQVGGTVGLEASAGLVAVVQTVADLGAIASATVDQLTVSCRAMSERLGAPAGDRIAASAHEGARERMQAWCALAVSALGTMRAQAGGSTIIDASLASCTTSVSAFAACRARCEGAATCDLIANPPTCEGGALTIACRGDCTANAGASVRCEGTCTGECAGSCTAESGVECAGKCDGICTISESGGGNGIQADGTCDGVCAGTCLVTAPGASCSGTCMGSCSASCLASAAVPVLCDGNCDGDFDPLACEGGELRGGCEVEPLCETSCNAAVAANADCAVPIVRVSVSGAADIDAAGRLKSTLEAHLGVILSLDARLVLLAPLTSTLAGDVDDEALSDIGTACVPRVLAALADGSDDVDAAAAAAASLVAGVQ